MITEIAKGVLELAVDLIRLALDKDDAMDPAKLALAVQSRLMAAQTWLAGLSAIHAADWDPSR